MRVHAGIVLVLVALTVVLVAVLVRQQAPASVTDRARTLVALMVAQGVIGYTQYFSHLPALLVGVHVFGATVVWTAMLWFHDGLTSHRDVAALADAPHPAGVGSPAVAVVPPDLLASVGEPVRSPVDAPGDVAPAR